MMLTIQADDTYTTANLNWRLKLIIEIHFFAEKLILFVLRRACVCATWWILICSDNRIKLIESTYLGYAVGDPGTPCAKFKKS